MGICDSFNEGRVIRLTKRNMYQFNENKLKKESISENSFFISIKNSFKHFLFYFKDNYFDKFYFIMFKKIIKIEIN